jgi:hypothetical protein
MKSEYDRRRIKSTGETRLRREGNVLWWLWLVVADELRRRRWD